MQVISEKSADGRYQHYYATDDDAFRNSVERREYMGLSTLDSIIQPDPELSTITFYMPYYVSGQYMPQITVKKCDVSAVFARAAEWYCDEKIAYQVAMDAIERHTAMREMS